MTIQLFKKMGAAFSVLVMASALTACGNNGDGNNSNCGSGQIEASIGGADAQCYTTCEADATACGTGKECKTVGGQKLCMDATSSNNNTNTTNQCSAGTVQATFMGEAKCWTSCTDGAECAATDECRLVGQVRICTPRECPVGNVKATYQGVEKCYKTCTATTECDGAAGEECVTQGANKICAVPPASPFKELCEQAAKAWFGECATANCDATTAAQLNQAENPFLQGGGGQPGCEDQAEADEGFALMVREYAAGYARGGCEDGVVKHGLCYFVSGAFLGQDGFFESQCGCDTPNIGGACANDDECPQALGSGACDTEAPGGQCNYSCLPFNLEIDGPTLFEGEASGCTSEGVCVAIPNGNQIQSFCLEDCKTNADCERGVTGADDAGYACSPLLGIQGGGYQGACLEACVAGEACEPVDNNGTMIPRTCGTTRTCENDCDPTADTNPSCRTGETCVALAADPTKGTCHNPGLDGTAAP